MDDFKRDLEKLIEEGMIGHNKGKMRFKFRYGNILTGDIENLGLSNMSYNTLRRANIKTIEGVSDNWDNLARVKNLGEKKLKEVKNKYLAWYYYNLDKEQRMEFWMDVVTATKEME